MRDGKPRDVEHGRKVDGDNLVPIVRRVVGDRQSQAGDAGVIDEHVKPTERTYGLRHHSLDLGAARHVIAPRRYSWNFLGDCCKGLFVDVAEEDFGAIRSEGTSKLSADAGGPGRYQDALRHNSRQSHHTDRHGTTARPRFAGTTFTLERPESAKLKPLIR